MQKSKAAFTLIELIVVLGILALLLVLITPRVAGYVQSASDTTAKSNARAIMDASELYLMDQAVAGNPLAEILENSGPLDEYLNLGEKDIYSLNLIEAERPYYEGYYKNDDREVQIPTLEILKDPVRSSSET